MGTDSTIGNGAYAQITSESLIRLAEDTEARFGATAAWTLEQRDEAANKLTDERRFAQAKEYDEESLRRRLSLKEAEHSREDEPTLDNRMRLARQCSETENSEDAIKHFRAVLRSLEASDPLDWDRIVETRNELVYELWIEDRPDLVYEVIDISMETLDRAVPIFGVDHQAMIDCRYNLAEALFSTENFEDACVYFHENIGILESMAAEDRASKGLDEALIATRDRLKECHVILLGSSTSQNTKTQDAGSEHEEQSNEPDRFLHVDPTGTTQPHVTADQIGREEEHEEEQFYEANGGSDSQPVDTPKNKSEDASGQGPEEEEEYAATSVVSDGQILSILEPGSEQIIHSGDRASGNSSTKQTTSKRVCVGVLTPPDSPLHGVSPSFLDIKEQNCAEGGHNTNGKANFNSPAGWPSDMAIADRHTQSTGDIPSQVSSNPCSNALEIRPASVAEVERTANDWSGPNDIGIDPHPSDAFFRELELNTHKLLDKDFQDTEVRPKRVRIAILDTGVSMPPSHAERVDAQIYLGKTLDESLPPDQDENGHGTHCAGILMEVCPYANIYVYRISKGQEKGLRPEVVAEAIDHAVSKHRVDVISMSFGWREDNSPKLREALERAKQRKVLMFAAASNEGEAIAFPARADEVFAIDAAGIMGEDLSLNAPADGHGPRFTALGDEVLSVWPIFPGARDASGYKRMKGTSAATAVAAATAALLLTFARQLPLCSDPGVERHLKDMRGMRRVFHEAVGRKKRPGSDFTHLDITKFLRVDREYVDGGEWHDWNSLRMAIARKIVDCLSEREFGLGVRGEWKKKFTEFRQEHHLDGSP
ncbi:hypothetical protein SLS54_001879 [Diplodia seriata]